MKKYIKHFLDTPWQRVCFYFLLAFMAAWFHNLENQDELWNYAFASNIANGLLPYRDFNLLQTPLSCLVNGIAIFIFGHHLLVIRMMGVLLFTAIAALADRVSRQLGAKGVCQMFVPSVFLCMFFWNVFLEYSCLILFFELCLISFDLDWSAGRDKSVPAQICAGVLMGCAMMCKQTFGTFAALASWVSVVCVCRMRSVTVDETHTRRLTVHETLLALFYRMLGTAVPCFAFLFYLLGTGTFGDFWDMAFKGISTFTSSYSYWAFMKENPAYFFLGALLPLLGVLSVVIMVRYRGTYRARFSLIVTIYSAFGCVNMIPMANSYHVMTCSIPILLLLFTVLPRKLLNPQSVLSKRWRYLQAGLRIVAGIAVIGVSVFILFINPIDDAIHYDLTTDVRGLECTFMNEEQHEEITAVDAYVREQNEQGVTVYILDNFAPLYFLPSNQYHKYFDMFLVGNLGTKTPTRCLEEADKTAIFLIPDSSRGQFQYPRAEIEAFLKGLKKTGEIGDFAIYEHTSSQDTPAEEVTGAESSTHEEETSGEAKGRAFTEALLEQLDVQQDDLLLERYQQNDDMTKIVGISEMYSGSFTGTEKEEFLVLFRFCSEPPHAAGLDRVIAAVYDADTLDILAQYSLDGDHNIVQPLSDQSGRSAVLVLADTYGQGGTVSQTQRLYKIENGTFSETDPLGANRGSDEFAEYDSYLSKYCILAGENTLLVYDVSGTKSEDEHDYELEYELKHVMKWSTDTGSFSEK